ncbi:GIN domain-containing protein [Aquabacterium sp.]|uniref:GIN domain-containing protein n=1 Tax=Aquabacterium sp. TaxID=1872578 RepID=UPI002CC0620A|nr:DUF2807 domain-containing protein [Aquabacterium sp.]HSW05550.1 DUF2807 domain-containing protein [Aquabacterium sp.]
MRGPLTAVHRARHVRLLGPAALLLGGLLRPAHALAFDWPIPGVAVSGSGRLRREERALVPFSALKLGGSLAVELRQAATPRLALEGDDNILPLIETEMHDTTLHIVQRRGIKPTRLLLVLHTPLLDSVTMGGAAVLNTEAWQAPRLTVNAGGAAALRLRGLRLETVFAELGGAAVLTLAGAAGELVATLGGSAALRAAALQARSATLQIGGAGNALVSAREQLKASVGGAGGLRYHGQPRTELSRSGAGTIKALGDAPAG